MSSIKVYLADEAGFCFGVKNAIKLALKESKTSDTVYTLGSLVHNEDVIRELKESRIKAEAADFDFTGKTVLIRAHGVSSGAKSKLESVNANIIDATCPMVKSIKQKIDKALLDDSLVLLLGQANHPEAIGLKDYRSEVLIVKSSDDEILTKPAKQILDAKKITLLAQSTMLLDEFDKVSEVLLSIRKDATVINTICKPTKMRQLAVIELAKRLPLIIVVGDKKSANTSHLLALAKRYTKAKRILHASELDPAWFKGISEVGLTAGASTPDKSIKKVIQAIEEMAN